MSDHQPVPDALISMDTCGVGISLMQKPLIGGKKSILADHMKMQNSNATLKPPSDAMGIELFIRKAGSPLPKTPQMLTKPRFVKEKTDEKKEDEDGN